MRFAYPAIASSVPLSTTSLTRWWSPGDPVVPMYIPGRLRTGSSPSSTVICCARYSPAGFSRFSPPLPEGELEGVRGEREACPAKLAERSRGENFRFAFVISTIRNENERRFRSVIHPQVYRVGLLDFKLGTKAEDSQNFRSALTKTSISAMLSSPSSETVVSQLKTKPEKEMPWDA